MDICCRSAKVKAAQQRMVEPRLAQSKGSVALFGHVCAEQPRVRAGVPEGTQSDRQPEIHSFAICTTSVTQSSIEHVEFHGVDLSGAEVNGGRIVDAKFYGVDFSRATFAATTLDNAKFVGCYFGNTTFADDIDGRAVSMVEPLPEGWVVPSWAKKDGLSGT